MVEQHHTKSKSSTKLVVVPSSKSVNILIFKGQGAKCSFSAYDVLCKSASFQKLTKKYTRSQYVLLKKEIRKRILKRVVRRRVRQKI